MSGIKACIFDLDGVIVDTAKYHYIAWRRLANELGFDFSEEDNEQLKGVSREDSLDLILQWGGIKLEEAEKITLAERKNNWYREYILNMTAEEILEGVLPFLDELSTLGIRMSLGSSSKNARTIVTQIGLLGRFETVVDGNRITRSKPDPEVFQLAAADMGLPPASCIVFEDAISGVEAALNGGFFTVGVGDSNVLKQAHMVIPGFPGIHFSDILNGIGLSLH